jgi:hypothetical protein
MGIPMSIPHLLILSIFGLTVGAFSQTASPKAKADVAALVVLPPPRVSTNASLTWKYDKPMPSRNIVFEIWSQTNAIIGAAHWTASGTNMIPQLHLVGDPIQLSTNWYLFATAQAPPFTFPHNKPHALFIMRARDLDTGLVSDWASQ